MATPQAGTASIGVRGDFRPFDRQMSRFAVTTRSRFARVGKLSALGFAAGLGGVAAATKKAFGEFQEAEKATRQTQAVLKSTGKAANVTAKQIEALANSISLKAGIDDEAIQSSENLLLTFTKVQNQTGKGNKIFDQATKSIVDMAAAMAAGSGRQAGQGDLKSATIQIGKALQDPIKGITALARVGVNFDKQTRDRITLWVEEGKQLKAQKFILAELKREFGGSAAANALATDKMRVAINQLFESFGGLVGPTIEKAANKLAQFVNQMQAGEGAGGRFARRMQEVGQTLGTAFSAIGRVIGTASAAIRRFVQDNREQIRETAKAFQNLGKAIAFVFNSVILPVVKRAWPGVRQIIQGELKVIGGIIKTFSAVLRGDWGDAWRGLKQIVSGQLKVIGGIVRAATAPIREAAARIGQAVAAVFRKTFGALKNIAQAGLEPVGDGLRTLGRAAKPALDPLVSAFHLVRDAVNLVKDAVEKLIGALERVRDAVPHINLPHVPDLNPFNRKGGIVMRGGGLVPAMLSPGEVGVTPDGGQFRVPGARVAADSVPSMVPSGTAILTASGQRMAAQGFDLDTILDRQLPHFRRGGMVEAIRAARKAGFRSRKLVVAGAVSGAESGPRLDAVGDGGDSVGPWQVNLPSHPQYSRSRLLSSWDYSADAAWDISAHGRNWAPWTTFRTGAYKRFLGAARKALDAIRSGIEPGGLGPGGRVRVTPSPVTHPILSTQLRPLIDDALLGGIEAGRERTGHAGRVDLLQQVLEGIVPESGDRATRTRTRVRQRRGSGGKGIGGNRAYPFPVGAKLIGTPYSGTHTLGNWQSDNAIDLGVPLGTKVRAVASGKIGRISGGWSGGSSRFDGFQVYLDSVGGGQWWYTHLKNAGVKSGQSVAAGQQIGLSGAANGVPHLHLAKRPPGDPRMVLGWPKRRKGGIVGYRDGGAVFSPIGAKRQELTLLQLIGLLGRDQLGTANADELTRILARRVQGRSTGALVKAQKKIRGKIRKMARRGFTGPERIRTRRLRGALSLVQDEFGRPIGRALGASDRLQELIDRRSSTLSDRLTVLGVDPDSSQGLRVQQQEDREALFRLARRRQELQKALKRARRSGNKQAVQTVQSELNEVDDQMLGLRASILNLDKAIKENTQAQQDEIEQQKLEVQQQIRDLLAEQADRSKRIEAAVNSQGPALQTLLAGILDGGIGGRTGLGRSFPSFAGLGGLART